MRETHPGRQLHLFPHHAERGCLQEATGAATEEKNHPPGGNTGLKEARMIVEIIVAVVTCTTSVINTILAALSYLKGKDKE
ncbi:MAG: hypothetical protein IJC31_07300 [Spirochaetaceae bacterium]|nr:hypothetical protein [Spirochaetaceae bacterium]